MNALSPYHQFHHSLGKARKFSPEFKAQVVLEIVSGRKSLALASREYQIKNTVLSRWKAQFLEGAPATA